MLPVAFRNALDEDLNIPTALAVLHDEVRRGNTALAQHDARAGADTLDAVLAMTGVLGINPRDSPWDESTATPARRARSGGPGRTGAQPASPGTCGRRLPHRRPYP